MARTQGREPTKPTFMTQHIYPCATSCCCSRSISREKTRLWRLCQLNELPV